MIPKGEMAIAGKNIVGMAVLGFDQENLPLFAGLPILV